MLAMASRTTRFPRQHASSLTSITSMLAPTGYPALLQSLAHELAGLARQLVQMPVTLFLGIEHRALAVFLQQVGMNLPHLQ